MLQPIIIDFDEASKEWHANKKKTDQGYKYICNSYVGKTKRRCTTACYKMTEFCYVHRKQAQLPPPANTHN